MAQNTQPLIQQKNKEEILRIGAEEVLLDIIVRDKKGRPVTDLKAGDLEIYEDNVKQELSSFHNVNRSGETGIESGVSAPVNSPAANNGSSKTVDPLRQINLVSFVFERLSPDGRRNAKVPRWSF